MCVLRHKAPLQGCCLYTRDAICMWRLQLRRRSTALLASNVAKGTQVQKKSTAASPHGHPQRRARGKAFGYGAAPALGSGGLALALCATRRLRADDSLLKRKPKRDGEKELREFFLVSPLARLRVSVK
jgi:hypothetical protein